jgi:hypothetical protein
MSKFADTQEQLESRLRALEEGIHIPQGSQKKYVHWLENTNDAKEHAKMMILLQRTRELEVHEWRAIREQAYERFGKEEYKELLQSRAELIPEVPKGSVPRFERKKVMFGAMKEEQDDLTPEWEKRLPAIYEALNSGQDKAAVLRELVHFSEGEKRMRRVRKAIRETEAEWKVIVEQILETENALSWDEWSLPMEIRDRCSQIVKDVCAPMEEVLKSDSMRAGMKLLPELLARWDWYTKRQLELRQPIMEQWKSVKDMEKKLSLPRNYRPGLSEELKPKRPDMMVVEIRYLVRSAKGFQEEIKSEVIWDTDWEDEKGFRDWYQKRWCEMAAEKRDPKKPIKCFSPLAWVGTKEHQQRGWEDPCALDLVREWPVVWVGYDSDRRLLMHGFRIFWEQHLKGKEEAQKTCEQEERKLKDLLQQYGQYGIIMRLLTEEIKLTVWEMMRRSAERKRKSELEDGTTELMMGLENTLRIMMTNATERIKRTEVSEVLVESQHWARREILCGSDRVDHWLSSYDEE